MESDLTRNAQSVTANKQSSFLINLLSILLLVSCLIAGFFAWRTQQLVKELRVASNTLMPTPIATQTPDLTADWKTYINNKKTYQIKYPNQLVEKKGDNNLFLYATGYTPEERDSFVPNITIANEFIKESNFSDLKSWIKTNSKIYTSVENLSEIEINNNKFTTFKSDNGPTAYSIHYLISDTNNIYDFSLRIPGDNEDASTNLNNYLIEILSTLKFVDSNTTCTPLPECAYNTDPKKPTCKIGEKPFEGGVWCPRPTETPIQTTVCTMEAKICPDGTAIGRSGPNCEFPSCPKPRQ